MYTKRCLTRCNNPKPMINDQRPSIESRHCRYHGLRLVLYLDFCVSSDKIYARMPRAGKLQHAFMLAVPALSDLTRTELLRHPAVVPQVDMRSQLTCIVINRSLS